MKLKTYAYEFNNYIKSHIFDFSILYEVELKMFCIYEFVHSSIHDVLADVLSKLKTNCNRNGVNH